MKRALALAIALLFICSCSTADTGSPDALSQADRDYCRRLSEVIWAMSDSTGLDRLLGSGDGPDDDLRLWIENLPEDPAYLRTVVDTILENVKRLEARGEPSAQTHGRTDPR